MQNFLNLNTNMVKILGIGLFAFIICLFISKKITNQPVLINNSQLKENLNIYKEKLAQSNKKPYDLTIAGVKQINSQEYEMAVITLEQATKNDPNYRDGWLYLGMAYLKQAQTDLAIKALEQAKTKDPIYPKTYQYLSLSYEKKGDVALAKECYNRFKQLSQ